MAGLYIGAGFDSLVITSANGVDWKEEDSGANKNCTAQSGVAVPDGVLLCGRQAYKNFILFSRDGRRWDEPDTSKLRNTLTAAEFFQGSFVCFGGNTVAGGSNAKPYITESSNGRDWSAERDIEATDRLVRATAVGNDILVAVGERGLKMVTRDLKKWEAAPGQKAVDTLINIAYGNGVFVGGGLHGMRMYSEDGLKWTKVDGGEEGEHINTVLWTGSQFVAVGLGASYFSPDGRAWERVPNQNAPLDSAYGAGGFVGTRWKGRIVHSTDAVEWKEVGNFKSHINKLLYGEL